jgi:hypothetical protein
MRGNEGKSLVDPSYEIGGIENLDLALTERPNIDFSARSIAYGVRLIQNAQSHTNLEVAAPWQ